jgi:hypothetical protein
MLVALLTASIAHIAFFTLTGSNGLQAALSWSAISELLLVGLMPSLAVAVWLVFSPGPALKTAVIVAGAAAAFIFSVTLLWVLNVADPLSQAYASLRLLPAIGGALCAMFAYSIGSRFA